MRALVLFAVLGCLSGCGGSQDTRPCAVATKELRSGQRDQCQDRDCCFCTCYLDDKLMDMSATYDNCTCSISYPFSNEKFNDNECEDIEEILADCIAADSCYQQGWDSAKETCDRTSQ